MGPSPRRSSRLLLRDRRAAVLVEYTLLVTFVAIPTVFGLTAGAVKLVQSYGEQRARILETSP